MASVHNKNTNIEVALRKALWHKGIRYRKNYRILNTCPDIVLTKYKIAVFCDGDFWHGRQFATQEVRTNAKFWHEKIKRNIERDLENTIELRDNGWIVLRFWGTDIKKHLGECVAEVIQNINLRKNN